MFAILSSLLALLAVGVSATPTAAFTATPPGPTLTYGFHWIRNNVTDQYLQGATPYTPGAGVMGPGTSAGQFLIVSGGLIQLTSSAPSYTYTSFDSAGAVQFTNGDVSPSSAGTFQFVGAEKTLTWTTSAGETNSQFFVCGSKLYAKLTGAVLPNGCAAATLSSLETRYVL